MRVLYVDDLADAVVFLMDRYDGSEPINCGAGSDVSIRQLAETVGRVRETRFRYQQAGWHAAQTE